MRTLVLHLLLALAFAPAAHARTVLVPEQEGDLQRAILGAEPGDVLDVAPGFLQGAVVEIDRGLTLRSREPEANSVYRLIVRDAADPVVIEGFLFTGITGENTLWAGVDVWDSDATFRDCRFEGLQPGVFLLDPRDTERLRYPVIYSGFVNVLFERCYFRKNEANEGGDIFNFSGADGVAPVGYAFGTLSFRDCEFVEQENAIWSTVELEVVGCTFDRCRTSVIRADRDLYMKNSVVRDFEFHTKWQQLAASRLCKGLTGPAIVVDDLVDVRNNTFVDSRFVDESEGGCPSYTPEQLPPFLYITDDGAGEVSNNLVVGHPGPGIRAPERLRMFCNDVFDVDGPLYVEGMGDRTGLDGNLSVDPQFCHRAGGDYAVRGDGPAHAGACGLLGAIDTGCEKVSVLVSGFRAQREGGQVRLAWSLADAVSLELWREDSGGRWRLAAGPLQSWTDAEAPEERVAYFLRLAGGDEVARLELDARPAPLRSGLGPATPNPFNPRTGLDFEVAGPGSAKVRLDVFDARGRRVGTLVEERLAPGRHRAEWSALDARGRRVASGVYRAVLTVDGVVAGQRALVLVQ